MLPQPYDGNKPYIFISYAHRDKKSAFPFIERLCEQGYRVWYDQGIDPGTEWDETIADHVENCGCFIALMSKNYLDSSNCKDELNYARDCEKERLVVYLEEVELPGGMAMRINRLQAIFKYTYRDEDAFYDKLFSTPSLEACVDETAPLPSPEIRKPAPKSSPAPVPAWAPFFAGITGTVGAGVILLLDPDAWLCLVFAAVALPACCATLHATKNRVLGLLCTLFILTNAVCICMRLFFPLELWGILIGLPVCAPFTWYALHWWGHHKG